MSEISEKIRYTRILQFCYDKGDNAAQARRGICAIYSEDAISKTTAERWFSHFCSGNFDVEDTPRSGRPITKKVDEILEKVEHDQHISSYDIANDLGINQQTVN